MTTKRFVAVVLAASILAVAFPETARGGEPAARPAPSINLRAAIDRAAAGLASSASATAKEQRPAARASAGQAAFGGGGGGGKGMMIMTLVTTVVGLGATYYLIKEMQKQTDQAGQQ